MVAGKTAPSASAMALETVGEGDQDVLDAARLQVVEDLHPELGSFDAFDPRKGAAGIV